MAAMVNCAPTLQLRTQSSSLSYSQVAGFDDEDEDERVK